MAHPTDIVETIDCTKYAFSLKLPESLAQKIRNLAGEHLFIITNESGTTEYFSSYSWAITQVQYEQMLDMEEPIKLLLEITTYTR